MHLPGLLFHEHSSITGLVFYVQWLVFRDRFCDRYQFREYCSVISRHSVTNICDKCYVTGVPSVTGVLSPVCVPWPVFRLVSWVLFRDQPAFHDKCLWPMFRDRCSVTCFLWTGISKRNSTRTITLISQIIIILPRLVRSPCLVRLPI